jgi:hypothetical protein
MTGLQVSAEELKGLLVNQLEVIDGVAFEKACAIASRLRLPLEHTLAERGAHPPGVHTAAARASLGRRLHRPQNQRGQPRGSPPRPGEVRQSPHPDTLRAQGAAAPRGHDEPARPERDQRR